jgi:hypothetical protein
MANPMQPLHRSTMGALAQPASRHRAAHTSQEIGRADQLEYLADLILELKELADNLGCATLAGLLVVAHRESVIQARER